MGQLPPKCVTPDIVFSRAGVDYADPVLIKLGAVCQPNIVKAYIFHTCVTDSQIHTPGGLVRFDH